MPAVNCRLFIFTILLSARSAQALEIESGLWRHLDSGTTRCMNSQTIADEVRHHAAQKLLAAAKFHSMNLLTISATATPPIPPPSAMRNLIATAARIP